MEERLPAWQSISKGGLGQLQWGEDTCLNIDILQCIPLSGFGCGGRRPLCLAGHSVHGAVQFGPAVQKRLDPHLVP